MKRAHTILTALLAASCVAWAAPIPVRPSVISNAAVANDHNSQSTSFETQRQHEEKLGEASVLEARMFNPAKFIDDAAKAIGKAGKEISSHGSPPRSSGGFSPLRSSDGYSSSESSRSFGSFNGGKQDLDNPYKPLMSQDSKKRMKDYDDLTEAMNNAKPFSERPNLALKQLQRSGQVSSNIRHPPSLQRSGQISSDLRFETSGVPPIGRPRAVTPPPFGRKGEVELSNSANKHVKRPAAIDPAITSSTRPIEREASSSSIDERIGLLADKVLAKGADKGKAPKGVDKGKAPKIPKPKPATAKERAIQEERHRVVTVDTPKLGADAAWRRRDRELRKISQQKEKIDFSQYHGDERERLEAYRKEWRLEQMRKKWGIDHPHFLTNNPDIRFE